MLNAMWIAMLLASVICGALTGRLDAVARASTESANAAVTLALGLVGVTCFWLGLMRVLHEAGLMRGIARLLRPVMVRLFDDVPADHPAMGMMVMNMTCNILGLGNAATPFGLKAMLELERLNPHPGAASNAMALFLAINTSGLAVLPTGMVALRASLGSHEPGAIFVPTLIATFSAALGGIIAAKLLAHRPFFRAVPTPEAAHGAHTPETVDTGAAQAQVDASAPVGERRHLLLALALAALTLGALSYAVWQQAVGAQNAVGWMAAGRMVLSQWMLPILIVTFVLLGVARNVKIYEALVEGGKEGFGVALRIIPYLVAILTAVGMLRASGAVDMLVAVLDPFTAWVGMPAQALPMAILRPLTGSGAYAIVADIMRAEGPDSLTGQIVSTMMGSTETTFYVLALYLGVVGVKQARHAVVACLVADVAGMMASVWACRLLLQQAGGT
jgi:spore maturation protein SpmA